MLDQYKDEVFTVTMPEMSNQQMNDLQKSISAFLAKKFYVIYDHEIGENTMTLKIKKDHIIHITVNGKDESVILIMDFSVRDGVTEVVSIIKQDIYFIYLLALISLFVLYGGIDFAIKGGVLGCILLVVVLLAGFILWYFIFTQKDKYAIMLEELYSEIEEKFLR